MLRRVAILTIVVGLGFLVIAGWGYHALGRWQAGLEGERLAQFAQVAELIGTDVKQKLDAFLAREQKRPYTDYLFYNVTDQRQALPQRSSLGGRLEHGLAYGHFQIEPDGSIVTPNTDIVLKDGSNYDNRIVAESDQNLRQQIQKELLPRVQAEGLQLKQQRAPLPVVRESRGAYSRKQTQYPQPQTPKSKKVSVFKIDSLEAQKQASQTVQQDLSIVNANLLMNEARAEQGRFDRGGRRMPETVVPDATVDREAVALATRQVTQQPAPPPPPERDVWEQVQQAMTTVTQSPSPRQVSIRIEPFVPVQIAGASSSLFGGALYLVRHVQVEDRHLLQGFQLQEERLLELIRAAAELYTQQSGMAYALSQNGDKDSAYQRRLDFGVGEVMLNLWERNPNWLQQRSRGLRRWYFGMFGVVFIALGLGLVSLWRGALKQLMLARKKDDFISAVSHELRTPLTSIRMYAEMLEQGWVTSEEKQQGYYGHIRQESERLSRLIENVLDFSRMQQGRKKYRFEIGDVNDCVQQVVDVMGPYARERGFALQTDLAESLEGRFDRDAVTQIVVNLLDNAIKYARTAQDKTIWLRTLCDSRHVFIEVEDRGPGIPHSQRQKIFEQFYRTEDESTRETQGTGLGLALVKRFAEAHQGFVRLRTARPHGAVFRVALARDL